MTDTAVSPEQPSTSEPELTPEQTKDKALRAAYTKASQKVREDHRDEFNEAMATFAKEAGYEWTPRSTAEDRACGDGGDESEQPSNQITSTRQGLLALWTRSAAPGSA